MPSKKRPTKASEVPKFRRPLTLDKKMAVLALLDSGVNNTAVGRCFGLCESTVRGIKKNAEKIKRSAAVAADEVIVTKVEPASSPCSQEESPQDSAPSLGIQRGVKVMEVAQLSAHSRGGVSSSAATQGWTSTLTNGQRREVGDYRGGQGPTTSPSEERETVGHYPAQLEAVISDMGLSPRQVFNAGETGLFWKRLPRRTYLHKEESQGRRSGEPRPGKDKMRLLLCCNAEGECKMKPLLAYHTLNPIALRGLSKNMLPVHWVVNPRLTVTGQLFEDWFANHFAVEAERYCREQGLEFKVLLLLEQSPAHPPHLDSVHPNIRVRFLPARVASSLQPLSQGVLAAFKAFYLKRILSQMMEATDDFEKPGTRPTPRDWWAAFNMLHAINNVDEAWREVSAATVNHAWMSIWPRASVQPGGHSTLSGLVQNCVHLGRAIGGDGFLDLDIGDIVDLLDSHEEAVSVHDLPRAARGGESGEGVDGEDEDEELHVHDFTLSQLSELLKAGERLAQMAMDLDPSLERSQTLSRGLQSLMVPYRQMYGEKLNAAKHAVLASRLKPEPETSWASSAVMEHPALAASLQLQSFIRSHNFANASSLPPPPSSLWSDVLTSTHHQ